MISTIRSSSLRLLLVRNLATKTQRRQPTDNDSVNFGDLSNSGRAQLRTIEAQNRIPDDPDGYDKQEFDIKPRKNAYYYKWEISNNARKGSTGLRRALELFIEMKSEARLTPDHGHFSALLYGCAKAGHAEKALELYQEFLKYFKRPNGAIVTCLINACAECPYDNYGLQKLDWILNHLKIDFNYCLKDIHYRCLIKAYGKLGRIDLAASTFESMIKAGYKPECATFTMLLIACSSQTGSGALLALRVYKRMRQYGIPPDTIFYRNFLRCINHCGMGSPELLRQTLLELPVMTTFEQRLAYKAFKKRLLVNEVDKQFEWLPALADLSLSIKNAINPPAPPTHEDGDVKLLDDGIDKTSQATKIYSYGNKDEIALMPSVLNNASPPNLLSDDHLTMLNRIEAVQFDKLDDARARFQMFGGIEGFLETMKRDNCKPDIETFCWLCFMVTPDRTGLLPLFHIINEYGITKNENFFNTLIKVACTNYQNPSRLDLAFTFLEEMHRDGKRPNVATFEGLALACDTLSEALTLLEDIERCGFMISDVLVNRLITRACAKKDFPYLIALLDKCQRDFRNFSPDKDLTRRLNQLMADTDGMLVDYENGKLADRTGELWLTEENLALRDKFKRAIGNWLESVEADKDEDSEDAWEQFNVKSESRRQGYVNYVREFQALERAKQEALERGQSFGNLYAKVREGAERRGVNERHQNRPDQGQAL